MKITHISELLQAIRNGECDTALPEIINACQSRDSIRLWTMEECYENYSAAVNELEDVKTIKDTATRAFRAGGLHVTLVRCYRSWQAVVDASAPEELTTLSRAGVRIETAFKRLFTDCMDMPEESAQILVDSILHGTDAPE